LSGTTFTDTGLTNGTTYYYKIAAVNAGGTSTLSNEASAMPQVNLASTSTALSIAPSPAQAGQSVTFTATVTSSTAGTITGTVTFKDGSTTLGSGSVGSGGLATFSTSTLSVAGHSITAVYGGDSNYAGSTSSAVSETVNKATSTSSVITSLSPSTFGS